MLLAGCGFRDAEDSGTFEVDPAITPSWLAAAQVHATLALAAATVLPFDPQWQAVASGSPVETGDGDG